jgi:dihydroorotate dehydrogenase (fumarate)
MDLKTKYMGLTLSSPIIVSSSKLTSSVDNIKKYADQGAGAVILKSLFEEQILFDIEIKLDDHPMYYWYPTAAEHIKDISKESGVNQYIHLLEAAKKEVSIPVIPSINCITANEWPSFAKKLEDAGADGIELNISIFPFDENVESQGIEETYFEIISAVKEQVSIPIAVKIGPCFTNLSRMVNRLSIAGVDAIVMFNRYFRPDINIDNETVIYENYLSSPVEMTQPLRWIGALSNKVKCDLAASTGVFDHEGVVKLILAGASATQICSVIYKSGPEIIGKILNDLEKWMKQHHYNSIDQFKGKILKGREKTAGFERLQFMRKTTGLNF